MNVRQPHLSWVTLIPRSPLNSGLALPLKRFDNENSYELQDVSPGSYYIIGQRIDDEPHRSRSVIPIDIGDADIENADLVFREGHEIHGRVRFDGAPLGEVRVALMPRLYPDSLVVKPPSVNPDGEFMIADLPPGDYRLSVAGMPPDYYIKSARLGELDVLDQGITLRGAATKTLEVVLSANSGRIEGVVVDAAQKPAVGSSVVLVPEPIRSVRPDLFKTSHADDNGHFAITGIAPGNYQLYAWEDVEPGAYHSPAFMERYSGRGYRIQISAGSSAAVRLTRIR